MVAQDRPVEGTAGGFWDFVKDFWDFVIFGVVKDFLAICWDFFDCSNDLTGY